MTATTPKAPGRLLAWTALLVALAASVAANVAFARPAAGPRLSAGVAPVLVVLAAGLLERVPLGGIVWWRRWLAYGGLGVVVVAAFVTSFDHQHGLLLAYGNTETAAVLLPVAVDGLIVLASVCLTVIAERRRELAGVHVPAVTLDGRLTRDVHVDVDSQPAGTRNLAGQPVAGSTKIGTGSADGTGPRNGSEPSAPPSMAGRPSDLDGMATGPGQPPSAFRASRQGPDARQVEPTGDLTDAARAVAGELTAAGRKVSRDALAAGLRARGHRVGTDRAAALARTLTAAPA